MPSAVDLRFVWRDTALPGLAVMLDPERFVASLRPFFPEPCLVAPRIEYVRYKPTKNCVVAYRVGSAGNELEIYAKAHPAVRLGAGDDRRLGPRRLVLEDGSVMVSVFPRDPRLRALAALGDADTTRRWLTELLPDRQDLWGADVMRLRYMPERRYVGQLTHENRGEAALKVYIEREYESVRAPKGFESRGPLRLAKRLGHSDVHRTVVLEWLSGRSLHQAIADADFPIAVMSTVGASLAEFHRQQPIGLHTLTREAEITTLSALAANLSFLMPHLAGRFAAVASHLGKRLVSTRASIAQPIHGDFYAKQVVFGDDRVGILDLDRAAFGDRAADLGQFLAHLERDTVEGRLSQARLQTLRAALLDGYQAAMGESVERLPLHTATALLRLTPDPFRFWQPDWPRRIEAILERVSELEGLATGSEGDRSPGSGH